MSSQERRERSAAVDPRTFGDRFTSRLHEPGMAAVLGAALGIAFGVCFLTGLYSHVLQDPDPWIALPTRPAGLYRVTQGLHVLTGIASIPLLLAKLWVVYPSFWEWPPVRGIVHGLERAMLFPLVAGSLFLLVSGAANVARWYPYSFFFPSAHYAVAWITVGAMSVHLGVKFSTARAELFGGRRGSNPTATPNDLDPDLDLIAQRRRFLGGVAGISGLLFLATAGNTISPLSRLSALAQRRPNVGPQGLPVNKSAAGAKVVDAATSAGFRLTVSDGARSRSFTLDDVRDLPRHAATLPIACVEGWSASADWVGVRVGDLLAAAGFGVDRSVKVVSLQQRSRYATSMLEPNELRDRDTMLALELNGEELHLDHGFPVRLIAPNRPGVSQTKWVTRLEVQ